MKNCMNGVLVGAGLLLGAVGSVQAATYDFSTGGTVSGSNYTTTRTYGNVTVSGWANSTADSTNSTATGANDVAAGAVTQAYVGNYDPNGLGVINTNSGNEGSIPGGTAPNHAADNNKNVDVLMLSFTGGAVNLTSFQLGYAREQTSTGATSYNNQADIAVLAFTGSGGPVLPNGTLTYANLLSSGWTIIGNYSNVTGTQAVSTGPASSYWMIGAWSDVFNKSGYNADTTADFFKLKNVIASACVPGTSGCTGNTPAVPEPGSLALMSLALGGMYGLRRRKGA